MRKIMLVTLAVLVGMALISCGNDNGGSDNGGDGASVGYVPNQTAVAYAYTHGGYVGMATVEVDGDGNLDVEIDEAFLPHTLAIVDMESGDWTEDNTVYYVQRGEQARVARWVSYDGTNYVGVNAGGAMVYVEAAEDGSPRVDPGESRWSAQDLEQIILQNQSTMAAWYENIADGGFAVMTAADASPTPVTTTSYGSLTKEGSEYWNFGIGWQGNIDAIEETIEENGGAFKLDEMVRTDEGTWELADATTSATASDLPDYVNVVQTALGRLEIYR